MLNDGGKKLAANFYQDQRFDVRRYISKIWAVIYQEKFPKERL